MVRDSLKDDKYFQEYVAEEENRINKFELKLSNNEVREDRVINVKKKVYDLKFQILIANYSMGKPVENLIDDYLLIVQDMKELWDPARYEDMLWMLSIGVMLEIDDDSFNVLVNLVENSELNDFLFNFIIHSRKNDVEYQESPLLFKVPFNSLIKVINAENEEKAIYLMKEYLLEKWYVGHKDMGWYECHKHSEKLYFGYWSFESGALIKILGLDDSVLKDIPYYPYDMVHYKRI